MTARQTVPLPKAATCRVPSQLTLRWILWNTLSLSALFGLAASVYLAAGVAAAWTCLVLGAALGITAPPAHRLPPGQQEADAPKVHTGPLALVLGILGSLIAAVVLGVLSVMIVFEWTGDPWMRDASELRWDWLLVADAVLRAALRAVSPLAA